MCKLGSQIITRGQFCLQKHGKLSPESYGSKETDVRSYRDCFSETILTSGIQIFSVKKITNMTKVALDSATKFIEQKRQLEKINIERDLVKLISKQTMKFVERVRKLENPERNTKNELDGTGTLIVAAKCKDGVVMVADRRTMRGMEYREEKKIYEFYDVTIAFAGLTGLKDKFLEMVEGVLRSTRAVNLSEAIVGVEDTMSLISTRYESRLGGETRIEALLAGLEHLSRGPAKLYHVFANGYAEQVDFLCLGHGAPYATCLAQGLYQPDLSMERLAEIGIFLTTWVENVDTAVGGIPDVLLVENDKKIRSMEQAKVKKVYDNAKKIAEMWSGLLEKAIANPDILAAKNNKDFT